MLKNNLRVCFRLIRIAISSLLRFIHVQKKYIWILITCICWSGQEAKNNCFKLRHERRWQTIEKPSFTATIGRDKRIY